MLSRPSSFTPTRRAGSRRRRAALCFRRRARRPPLWRRPRTARCSRFGRRRSRTSPRRVCWRRRARWPRGRRRASSRVGRARRWHTTPTRSISSTSRRPARVSRALSLSLSLSLSLGVLCGATARNVRRLAARSFGPGIAPPHGPTRSNSSSRNALLRAGRRPRSAAAPRPASSLPTRPHLTFFQFMAVLFRRFWVLLLATDAARKDSA